MTERTFRIIFGLILLVALYFNLHNLILGLIALSLVRGATKWRISRLLTRLRPLGATAASQADNTPAPIAGGHARFNFEAEQALSLVVASILLLSCVLFTEQLWILPWFIGFALFGAGLSGVCPMVLALKWAGFQ